MRRPPKRSMLALAMVAVLAAGCGGEGEPPARAAVADAPEPSPTPRKIVVVVDKKKTDVMSTGTTVVQVLAQAKIALGPYDLVKPDRDKPAGDVIKIRRLLSKPVLKKVRLEKKTIRRKSSEVAPWSTKVVRKGRDGYKLVKVAYVRKRGKKVKTVLAEKIKRKPVSRILAVGPKSAVGGSVAELNWDALAECESGGNPRAVNPAGYYGLYQFSMQTWTSVGGEGKPTAATAGEQTYRAQKLYKKVNGRWQGQWPNCGSRLFS